VYHNTIGMGLGGDGLGGRHTSGEVSQDIGLDPVHAPAPAEAPSLRDRMSAKPSELFVQRRLQPPTEPPSRLSRVKAWLGSSTPAEILRWEIQQNDILNEINDLDSKIDGYLYSMDIPEGFVSFLTDLKMEADVREIPYSRVEYKTIKDSLRELGRYLAAEFKASQAQLASTFQDAENKFLIALNKLHASRRNQPELTSQDPAPQITKRLEREMEHLDWTRKMAYSVGNRKRPLGGPPTGSSFSSVSVHVDLMSPVNVVTDSADSGCIDLAGGQLAPQERDFNVSPFVQPNAVSVRARQGSHAGGGAPLNSTGNPRLWQVGSGSRSPLPATSLRRR
jgi:hypothetical protein